ncbi:hypothetical protein PI125_g26194 [Phytophthora idaei]|nr:hypothetical protein PI125_g26194 [Phytophthora idaei]
MSSLTKTPAQESASADTAASVPAQASTSATEFTLSVGENHALQYKKRVDDKAAAPETILEGSSVFNTDGSMPTDYGSDISDVPTSCWPQSRTIRSQGRGDTVKKIRALQVRSARETKKKRRHQHWGRLLLRVLSLQNALRGCQVHPRLRPGSVRLRHQTRSRCTRAAP